MIGKTISHYRIVEKLGEGGMGVVYVAEDTVLGRRVAIKTLSARTGPGDQHFRSRFLREARAISKLSHPHIANIYDYGETGDGEPYIVMELVSGSTLGDLMLKEKLTIPRAVGIIRQVAEALAEAHRHGIIHRDIKPSNVAINERGNVKVLDFGLAKEIETAPSDPEAQTRLHTQTREGVIVGTPTYLSPEQALGIEVDARSDLFSLGGLLYECIAGRPAFFGKTAVEICAKVVRDDPPSPSKFNPDVSRELDRIALKALAKKPEERYQTAEEMIKALELTQSQLNGSGQTVTRLMPSVPATQPSSALATLSDIFKRPRLSIGYVAAGLVLIVGIILGLLWWTRAKLPPPSPEAQQLYDKGVAALQEGSYFKASRLLERALSVEDKFPLAHARLAEAYTELDYTDKAKDHMLSASRIVTSRSMLDQTSALYFDAISATVTHDLPVAITAYTELAQIKPDAAAFVDLGRAFEAHDEIDKAIAQYSKATDIDHNNPAAFLRLAVLHGRRQDLSNANAAFDKAESLNQDNQNFEGSSEVFYQRGSLLAQMSKIPEALKAGEKALNLATTADNKYQQVRALLMLSTIAYSSGNTEQAQTLITRALELARANGLENLTTQGLLDLGNTLLLKRSFPEAERYVRQAYDLAQTYREKRNEARANLLLGSTYIQQEDADKGKPFIDQALVFYKAGGYRREISRCMAMIGRSQLLKGDFDGAVKTFDEQLQLAKQVEDPGQLARSQEELAAALGKLELYPQAQSSYLESYQQYKLLGNDFHMAFCLLNRGDMLARLGSYDEANSALNELDPVLARLPSDNKYKTVWSAFAFLIRAQMDLSQENPAQARVHCQKAQATIAGVDPNTLGNTPAAVKEMQGLIEVYSGSAAKGVKLCEEALALVSGDKDHEYADTYAALAVALLANGDATNSLTYALKAGETFELRHRPESQWRVLVIAGRASAVLKDDQAKAERFAQAQKILSLIASRWGQEAYKSYSARKDIQRCQSYVANLS